VDAHLAAVGRETLADAVHRGRPDTDAGSPVTVELAGSQVTIRLRALGGGPADT
jgi:hypothetical protein